MFEVKSPSSELCCQGSKLLSCQDITLNVDNMTQLELAEKVLFQDKVFNFINDVEPNGRFFKSSDGDNIIFTINKKLGSLFGSIKTMDERSFGIEMCRNGYVLKEFDMDAFPQEITFSVNQSLSSGSLKHAPGDERKDKVVTYSVMFYYTPQFAAITQDIAGYIDQVLAETNQGYINSNIPIRSKTPHIAQCGI